MTSETPTHSGEQPQQRVETGPGFEATILAALEISPYDLATLEAYLIEHKWIPTSTEDEAIKRVVIAFRTTYDDTSMNPSYIHIFQNNKRLARLFKPWATREIEDWEMETEVPDIVPRAQYDLELQRETAKYNAVYALFVHLAARKSRITSLQDITDEQAMDLVRTNACLRGFLNNKVKKAVAKETETLNQKIADKDAEMSRMATSLA